MQIRPKCMGVDGRLNGLVPRRRSLFSIWLKVLNAVIYVLRSVSKYSIPFNNLDSELFIPLPLVPVWPQTCGMTWIPETEKSLGNHFNSLSSQPQVSALFFLQLLFSL